MEAIRVSALDIADMLRNCQNDFLFNHFDVRRQASNIIEDQHKTIIRLESETRRLREIVEQAIAAMNSSQQLVATVIEKHYEKKTDHE